jgi:putative SOS response-associated peptidase YedK
LRESYNVAPQTLIYAVLDRADPEHTEHVERQVHLVRWGLVPSGSRDPKIGNKLVNARVETLSSKPSWRTAYRKRRCLIPADGYYEWQPEQRDGRAVKQPYYLHPAGGGVLSFAGSTSGSRTRARPRTTRTAGCGARLLSPPMPLARPARSTTALR